MRKNIFPFVPSLAPSYLALMYIVMLLSLLIVGQRFAPKAHAMSSAAEWVHSGAQFETELQTYCSVGFPATDAQGNHYFITALHCFVQNHTVPQSHIYDYDPIDGSWDIIVGQLYTYVHPDSTNNNIVDAALVKMLPGAVLSGGLIGVPVNIVPTIPSFNTPVCAHGYRDTSDKCGIIFSSNASRNDHELGWHSVGFTTNVCVLPGDSGGPVWSPTLGALGIVQAGNSSENSCRLFSRSWFTPLSAALSALQLQIPSLHLV